jgi:hypothetical protein
VNELPSFAAWRQLGARQGFEVAFFLREADGYTTAGQANAVEDGSAWALEYRIGVDESWATRTARITSLGAGESQVVEIEADGRGRWLVGGERAPELDGCRDLDLEASVFTNGLPVRRLGLAVGERAEVPAAYVRMPGLRVERLHQVYVRLPDSGGPRYAYSAPAFGFTAALRYDADGLLLDYPGIGTRCG